MMPLSYFPKKNTEEIKKIFEMFANKLYKCPQNSVTLSSSWSISQFIKNDPFVKEITT